MSLSFTPHVQGYGRAERGRAAALKILPYNEYLTHSRANGKTGIIAVEESQETMQLGDIAEDLVNTTAEGEYENILYSLLSRLHCSPQALRYCLLVLRLRHALQRPLL